MVHLHSCSLEQLRLGEVIEALQQMRAAGKTRCIGYSGNGRAALFAVKSGAFAASQGSSLPPSALWQEQVQIAKFVPQIAFIQCLTIGMYEMGTPGEGLKHPQMRCMRFM